MKKRLLSLTLAGILAIGAFTGCGSSGSDTKDTKEAKSTQEDSKKAVSYTHLISVSIPFSALLLRLSPICFDLF